jgi:hypothetical protein
VQIFGDIMADESEKGGYRKRFVAVAKDFEVDAMLVIFIRKP